MEREHSWPHALPPSISPPRATTQKVLLIVVSAPERRMQNGNPAMVARIRGGAQLRRGVAHHIGGAGSAHKGGAALIALHGLAASRLRVESLTSGSSVTRIGL